MAGVVIRPFAAGDEVHFRDINLDWISRHFAVEAKDRETLDAPAAKILDPGGAILMADVDGETVGCVALVVMGADTVELAKMGVLPKAHGRGAGKALVAAAIGQARKMGKRRVYIETNSTLKTACALYDQAGFKPLASPQPSPYARADVQLELWL